MALVFAAGSVQASGIIEEREWEARYNGPGNNNDGAVAIALDSSGNIYVTGTCFGAGTFNDYATIKYDTNGNQNWVTRYSGPGNYHDEAYAIAVDSSGNGYVTGSSYGSGTSFDYATIKYDTSGNQNWVARYNGPGNSADVACAIAVDSSGNIYVTGASYGSGTSADYATIKYDTSGNQNWVARYNGPGNSSDGAAAIALDGSGNVYVTGTSGEDYATLKYDASGTQLWVRRYNGPAGNNDHASDIALDSSGNVYVTGTSLGSGTDYDYATIKYDPNGTQKWLARYNGPANSSDVAYAIVVDGSGNIYVTGNSIGSGTNFDYATIKYDTSGNQLWVRTYNGPGNSIDNVGAIAVDGFGNVYLTGKSCISGTDYDYATVQYDSAGNELCVRGYNGPVNSTDNAAAIALDGSGNIYVTGTSISSGTNQDYATVKYKQYKVILTMQTEPPEVNTVTPASGTHECVGGVVADISAQRLVTCPNVYAFDHWEGDVNDPNSANTTIVMNMDKTVKAVFVDGRQCGDECHPYPIGDFDKDCEVTFSDFALFAFHWLECTKPECD
jgi:hypothetical protein